MTEETIPAIREETIPAATEESISAATMVSTRVERQGPVLIMLAAVCALVAVLRHPGEQTGLLALGIGLLGASCFARWRMLLAGVIIIPYALVNVLWSAGILSGATLFGDYVLAAAIGIGAATLAARCGLVSAYPILPVVLLASIGILLVMTAFPTFNGFFTWFTSWWMPAVVLAAIGIVRLIFFSTLPPQTGKIQQ